MYRLVLKLTSEFSFLSPEYIKLFENADATAFQHPLWMDRMFSRLGSGDRFQFIIGRVGAEGTLVFVMPVAERRLGPVRVLDAVDFDVGDYNAFVIDRIIAADVSAMDQLVGFLNSKNLVCIRKVHGGNIGFPTAERAIRSQAMTFMAHEMELGVPVLQWQSKLLQPVFQKFLKKKRKGLAGRGKVAFRELVDASQIRSAFDTMRRLRRKRWSHDVLADEAFFEFYIDVAVSGCDAGFSRTYVLSVDDDVAAVMFGVVHGGRFCFLLLGYDSEIYRNFSPGMLILENAVEHSILKNDRIFDLTIGDEAYKQKFATRSVPMQTFWFGQRPWISMAPMALWAVWKIRDKLRSSGRIDEQAASVRTPTGAQ